MLRLSAILCLLAASTNVLADDTPHSHKQITLPQAPSISRLKVDYAQPQDVAVDSKGNVVVADSRAGVVFRTSPDGVTVVLANRLDQPVRVQVDEETGDTFVITAAQGRTNAGCIYRVSPQGERETIHESLTAPVDFLRTDLDDTIVALKKDQILRLNPEGQRELLCDQVKSPTALARGVDGELFVANRSGSVFQLLANGRIRELANGLKSPTDLSIAPDGRLIVADREAKQLTVIEKGGEVRVYAKVPRGTIAVAFSKSGNMVIGNRDLQSVTRVTSHLQVPCPHCDKSIPVLLKRPKPPTNSF
ncbi:MAG: hypothetical protein AB8G99_06065 [Planctomycetaceae bacterium]